MIYLKFLCQAFMYLGRWTEIWPRQVLPGVDRSNTPRQIMVMAGRAIFLEHFEIDQSGMDIDDVRNVLGRNLPVSGPRGYRWMLQFFNDEAKVDHKGVIQQNWRIIEYSESRKDISICGNAVATGALEVSYIRLLVHLCIHTCNVREYTCNVRIRAAYRSMRFPHGIPAGLHSCIHTCKYVPAHPNAFCVAYRYACINK